MIIGIPKEIMHEERRVAAAPEAVEKYIKDGFDVLIEKNAGLGANFKNESYEKVGAKIIDDPKEIFEKSDIILKVKEPQFNEKLGLHEVDMMHEGQYLLTFIHPAAPANHEMVKNLAKKGVISFTLEGIPRISRAQNMDALTSMSTCAGYKGILMAANLLTKFMPQIFTAVGMIKPANCLVIGTGVGGLQAIATAKRLGCKVTAADIRPDASEQAGSLGAKTIDLGVDKELAIGEGGYAKKLPDEVLEKEREVLQEHVKEADVIFLSALVPGKMAPILITEDMVKEMKEGSVIVDISIDQGGNCEITPPGEIEEKYGVSLVGIKNIPGELPTSSTWMFSQNLYNFVSYLFKDNKPAFDLKDEVVNKSITTMDGKIVHQGAKEAMGL
ncbi:MAG: NAD(P) transhydrogenase subunit alpha [Tissierellia bacterium]|nr:NAD(P) transhydrogenase subunit alpha [Tissierellia bacterium]